MTLVVLSEEKAAIPVKVNFPELFCQQRFLKQFLLNPDRHRHPEGLETARFSKAFSNDILLALSCREAGCVLVTDNERDFQRIRRFVQFQFTKPWPGTVSVMPQR